MEPERELQLLRKEGGEGGAEGRSAEASRGEPRQSRALYSRRERPPARTPPAGGEERDPGDPGRTSGLGGGAEAPPPPAARTWCPPSPVPSSWARARSFLRSKLSAFFK